jgi:hypothetical protein
MSDKILERYTGRDRPQGMNGIEEPDESEIDDLGVFGFLRGSRERAVMLELRKRNGNILAVGYGWLERAEFDPSEGITLHLVGRTIRLKGRNLNSEIRPHVRFFEALARHRVPWIQECSSFEKADEFPTVIDQIEW